MKKILWILGTAVSAAVFSFMMYLLNFYLVIKTGREIPIIADIIHDDLPKMLLLLFIISCFVFFIVRDIKKNSYEQKN